MYISIDNTNRQNMELFAGVVDLEGEGLPVSFLFIVTDRAAAGAKQEVLERWYLQLRERGIRPEFTLSDKDWSEINALRKVWPNAKHQLCFWHALRAIKLRLAQQKGDPAHYNPEEAHLMFSFIDVTWLPLHQLPVNKVEKHVASNFIYSFAFLA